MISDSIQTPQRLPTIETHPKNVNIMKAPHGRPPLKKGAKAEEPVKDRAVAVAVAARKDAATIEKTTAINKDKDRDKEWFASRGNIGPASNSIISGMTAIAAVEEAVETARISKRIAARLQSFSGTPRLLNRP